MNATSQSGLWPVVLAVGLLVCGGARGLAADTAAGLANWFETVAEAERLADDAEEKRLAAAAEPGPRPPPAPAGPTTLQPGIAVPAASDDLRLLIDQRNRLVTESLLSVVKKLVLGGRPSGQQLQSLRDWFATYFQMREFMPSSRNDPNLPAVTNILEEAVKRRGSFVEGRVLLAACYIYASRAKDAHAQAEEASKFLDQRGLNPTPFGLDCCAVWLRMGRPDDVQGFIDVLKNEKIIPANKLTAFQALLVAVHSWQTFRFNESKDYFEKSLQKCQAFGPDPLSPAVQGLLADAALFYLVAGNKNVRDASRAEMLLKKIPDSNHAWAVVRARAALHAVQASAADDATLWDTAVRQLEACRQDALPTLDTEIDQQLAMYRQHELWFRERAKPRP